MLLELTGEGHLDEGLVGHAALVDLDLEKGQKACPLEMAITLGIPLITADEKIIRWNEVQRLVQVIALQAPS